MPANLVALIRVLLDSDRILMGTHGQDRARSGTVRLLASCFAVLILLSVASTAGRSETDPSDEIRQARVLMRQGEWKKAEAAVDRALEKSPQDATALYWKAYVLFQAGQYEQSSAYITRHLGQNSLNPDAHKILGLSSFMLGRKAEAETELWRACELAPGDIESRYYLGRVQFERQNMPAALESFRLVVAREPASVRGYNHLGQTLEGLARFGEAREAYQTAVRIEQEQTRKSEWPYFNLGVLAIKEGHAEEAVRWLKEALARRPSWPEATVQLAAAMGSLQQYEEARQLLEGLVKAEPRNAAAHYQLARLLIKMRRPEEAQRHFQLFSELKQP